MTDKEWKELCEWAKSLKNKSIKILFNTIYRDNDFEWDEIIIDYRGNINQGDNMIALNRTAKQIKELIKNIVDEVSYDKS